MTRERGKGVLRGAAVLLVALLLALIAPTAAQAHSELQRSDPLDGGVVPEGRTSLTLWFGEPVTAASSSFVLRSEDGSLVPTQVTAEGGATTVLELTTEPLARQTYTLDWRVFSVDDGHTTSGTLAFGAGIRPQTPASRGTHSPPVVLLLVRWVDLTALLAALGALTVGGRVLGTAGASARRRARSIGVVGAMTALYAGLVTPFLRTFDSTQGLQLWLDQTLMTLTATPSGRWWLGREVALAVAVVSLTLWRRAAGRPTRAALVATVALVAAAGCEAWAGHASGLPTDSTVIALAATAHVVAAGVWAGGLGVLAWCLVPALRAARGDRRALLVPVWRAYSPLAAVSTGVLLATGLLEAGRHLPDLGAVTSTLYGAAVAGKTLLVLLALAFAAVNTLTVHPTLLGRIATKLPSALTSRTSRRTPRGFARTVTTEVVVLGLAVGLAAVATSTATSREEIDARRPTTVHVEQADGLFVTFEEVPGGPGKGRLIVRTRSLVRPNPSPVVGVDVELDGPGGSQTLVPLATTDPERYEGTTAEPTVGTWTATVKVHRRNAPDTTTASSWTVEPTSADHGGGFERATSVLAGLLLGATALFVARRRRPRTLNAPDPLDPTDVSTSREKSLQ